MEEPFGSHWHTAVWFEESDHVGGVLLPVPLLLSCVTSARSFLVTWASHFSLAGKCHQLPLVS